MACRNVIALQSEQAVKVALPNVIEIGTQRPALSRWTPQNLAADAGKHAFQIAGLQGGENFRCRAEAIIGCETADACLALLEILHKVGADMRQYAVAFAPRGEAVDDAGFCLAPERQPWSDLNACVH